ncbi:MAG TPA: low molecular weight phosphotyrosine protein phosphatase, partial [Burkholderiales bacterium]|nr:low molecular weight phosphotyrosine protein phosphatase [Burkholderiales bacterium]
MLGRVNVLFVCTGNICRSPTAEGVLRALAAREGMELHIESAGIGRWHVGCAPDERAQ